MNEVIKEEHEVIVKDSEILISKYENYAIATQQQLTSANDDLMAVSERLKKVQTAEKGLADPAYKTYKGIKDFFRPAIDGLTSIKDNIAGCMRKYIREEEIKREREEAKAAEKARLEEIRLKKEKEEQAKKWEEKGKEEKAEGIRQEAEQIHVPAPVQAKVGVGIDRRRIQKKYTFRVIDFSKVPDEYKLINESALKGLAKSTKCKAHVPGVTFIEE